ncbi:hypothetical protein [Paraburkholderia hospita]|jgi:hypothetical protein|uniref:hypothetical protein n=1 Tax=Paraburkholderia hospita TaxID=169430 RepID=UPI000B34810D|nr:hypothetical protein [Paraburkholderia hospita]OUL85478.1 hypothetical protein CA603_23575 [Paraburkholderia hospita]
MDLSGKISGCNWTVVAQTHAGSGGFGCQISTNIAAPAGDVKRGFAHDQIFLTPEEAAVLEGLREGMDWIGLTTSHTISAN